MAHIHLELKLFIIMVFMITNQAAACGEDNGDDDGDYEDDLCW